MNLNPIKLALGATALLAGLSVSEHSFNSDGGLFMSDASAIIGRPVTPMSYAGVARRTTARAVGAATVVVPVAPVTRCVQTVDAYGRVITRCY